VTPLIFQGILKLLGLFFTVHEDDGLRQWQNIVNFIQESSLPFILQLDRELLDVIKLELVLTHRNTGGIFYKLLDLIRDLLWVSCTEYNPLNLLLIVLSNAVVKTL
jgi:hypothetical protein